ncbi:unnamed protein product [Heterobilharzia americana]|nr:unnamed protein product [Heterobilharzia americana]
MTTYTADSTTEVCNCTGTLLNQIFSTNNSVSVKTLNQSVKPVRQPANLNYSMEWARIQLTILPILSLLIGCIGLIGNCLNFLVLHVYPTSQVTFGGECTARVNLLGLALADFLVCLASLPLAYVQRRHTNHNFMLYYTIYGPGLVTYFLTVSVWMVLLMSIVRYLVVCRPLASRACLTSRHMLYIIALLYALALLFHIPSFLAHTYREDKASQRRAYNSSNQQLVRNQTQQKNTSTTANSANFENFENTTSVTIFVIESEIWNNDSMRIAYAVSQIILTNIGPFIGVVITNVSVIRACRQSDACRKSYTYDSHKIFEKSIHNNLTQEQSSTQLRLQKRHLSYLQRDSNNINQQQIGTGSWRTGSQGKAPVQRIQQRATNRVTPLLLAVILAFLLFTAPFGIVHFVCLQVMSKMGSVVRHDKKALELYMTLNLTVEWTNVIQLLGCASNFFLYFLVSTTFRRTTKRLFQRFYKAAREYQCPNILHAMCSDSKEDSSWDSDTRTKELRKKLADNLDKQLYPQIVANVNCRHSENQCKMNLTTSSSNQIVDSNNSKGSEKRKQNSIKLRFYRANRKRPKSSQDQMCINKSYNTRNALCNIDNEFLGIHTSPPPCVKSSISDIVSCNCVNFHQTHYKYLMNTSLLASSLRALTICPECAHVIGGYASLPESKSCLLKPCSSTSAKNITHCLNDTAHVSETLTEPNNQSVYRNCGNENVIIVEDDITKSGLTKSFYSLPAQSASN